MTTTTTQTARTDSTTGTTLTGVAAPTAPELSSAAPLSPTELRAAWASIPTPITTVAAVVDGAPVGLIVGSYVGLSLEPALVAVSIQKSSRSWPLIRRADHIGVSVLTTDHAPLVRQLAGPQDDRFTGIGWEDDRGAVLLEDAVVHLTGQITEELETGDHVTAILQVDRVISRAPSAAPLVFHGSQVSSVGGI